MFNCSTISTIIDMASKEEVRNGYSGVPVSYAYYFQECYAPTVYYSIAGVTCTDPGRPADGAQIATSYELGKQVSFTCNRTGFSPSSSSPLTCILDGSTLKWNAALPTCRGQFL